MRSDEECTSSNFRVHPLPRACQRQVKPSSGLPVLDLFKAISDESSTGSVAASGDEGQGAPFTSALHFRPRLSLRPHRRLSIRPHRRPHPPPQQGLSVELATPRKPLREIAQTPTSLASSVSSLSTLSELSGILFQVEVLVEEVPAFGPVFFTVRLSTVASGVSNRPVWAVSRRYSAFDALQAKLRWDGLLMSGPELPPKKPPPGYDLDALTERACGLARWANYVLEQPAALRHPDVIVFFDLPRTHQADLAADLANAEAALLRLQAVGRGFLSRNTLSPTNSARRMASGEMVMGLDFSLGSPSADLWDASPPPVRPRAIRRQGASTQSGLNVSRLLILAAVVMLSGGLMIGMAPMGSQGTVNIVATPVSTAPPRNPPKWLAAIGQKVSMASKKSLTALTQSYRWASQPLRKTAAGIGRRLRASKEIAA